MIKVGIVGISGYSGMVLLELLLNHPEVRVTYVSANNSEGHIDDLCPQLKGRTNLYCQKYNYAEAAGSCDLIFLAVPHRISMLLTPQLLKAKVKVIDLSADYRLKSTKEYKKWYGLNHEDAKNIKKAVYGLSELHRPEIKSKELIANPGCHPTVSILALAPFITAFEKSVEDIFIDAKSGVSGAGKKASVALNFCEVNENFKAYKVLNHQHQPEINQSLSSLAERKISVQFVPHLLPINRGILATCYIRLNEKISAQKVQSVYQKFYKTEPFVRVCNKGQQPELKNVVKTNYCDIGIALDESKKLCVVTAVIDNLVKGAAGQAVQNMNIMYGFEETLGLVS